MAILNKKRQDWAQIGQSHPRSPLLEVVLKSGLFALLGLALGACSTDSKNLSENRSQVPNPGRALSIEERDPSILRDLAKGQSRNPAAQAELQSLNVELTGLRNLKPKKFEIFVFPKNSKQTHKELTDSGPVLGKPYVVEVSPLVVGQCSIFAKGQFKESNPKEYFSDGVMKSKQNCAIIEFTSGLSKISKDLWRNGDVHKKRIYIDDNYRAYGMETGVVADGRDRKTIKHKLDPQEGLSSALDGIPMDLPVFESILGPEDENIKDFSLQNLATPGEFRLAYNSDRPLDRLSLHQIKELKQDFELSKCNGRAFAYKDSMRKRVKVYWCRGKAWPQAVETEQYFAVTQNLGVK